MTYTRHEAVRTHVGQLRPPTEALHREHAAIAVVDQFRGHGARRRSAVCKNTRSPRLVWAHERGELAIADEAEVGERHIYRVAQARSCCGSTRLAGVDLCVRKANEGDEPAVGVLTAFLMGMRASEVTDRMVRHLDDDGRLLWIEVGKTKRSRRTLEVPALLRPCPVERK